jgi:hypothetical protein
MKLRTKDGRWRWFVWLSGPVFVFIFSAWLLSGCTYDKGAWWKLMLFLNVWPDCLWFAEMNWGKR